MSNLTRAVFTNSEYCVAETPLWQFDYGQQLQILGIELPDAFEAHFSNDPTGESKTQIGEQGIVNIPDEYLLNSGYLYVWVYLHTSTTDGETRYQVKIKVRERATPTDTEPTPQQQDAITEAIAALNEGVSRSETAASLAEQAKQDAETSKNEAKRSEETAKESEQNASDSAEDSEAWAIGQRGGADVSTTDETYHNNAKYWAKQAEHAASGGVVSVNGMSGAVTLTQDNVPAGSTYTRVTPAQVRQIADNATAIGLHATAIFDNVVAITQIKDKIPPQASSNNQLADKQFVNSSIQTSTAHYRGSWATWAAVPTDASLYPQDDDGVTTPTSNDYLVVQDAADYPVETDADALVGTWRFKYSGLWATNGRSGWHPEYQVNEEPLTAAQIAAINSGITAAAVAQIGANQTSISGIKDGASINSFAGVEAALAGKQSTLTFDQTPTVGSSNPVTSDGIATALAGAADSVKPKIGAGAPTSATVADFLGQQYVDTTDEVMYFCVKIDGNVYKWIKGGGSSLELNRIYIYTQPTKTTYKAGETFDSTGMVVKADYDIGGIVIVEGVEVTGYSYPTGALSADTTSITITYAENGVTKTATVAVVVTKTDVTIPTYSGNLIYNGSAQTPTFDNDPGILATKSGNISETNASTNYKTRFTLNNTDLYQWSDGSTDYKEVMWSIGRKDTTISVSPYSVTIDADHLTATVTVTTDGDGELSVESSASGVATASISGKTVTVSHVNRTNGTATITVRQATGANYNAVSVTFIVEASFFSATLNVTAVVGAIVTAVSGSDSYSATASSNGVASIAIGQSGTYTVTGSYQDAASNSQNVSVTQDGGTYSATVSFITLALTAPNGSIVTLTNGTKTFTGTGAGSAVIYYLPATGTWTATATKDGESTSGSVSVSSYTEYSLTLEFIPENFSDATWVQVAMVGAEGKGDQYWDIGDMHDVILDGTIGITSYSNKTMKLFIAHFNYKGQNGIYLMGFKNSASGKVLGLCDANYNSTKNDGTKTYNMNHWGGSSSPFNTNYGGWKGCDLRYDILGSTNKQPSGYGSTPTTSRVGYDPDNYDIVNSPVSNTLMAALPSALREHMKSFTVYTDNTGNSSTAAANVTASVDYIVLPAEYEVFAVNAGANENEGAQQEQLKFYELGNSKITYKNSDPATAVSRWERSPRRGYAISFRCVNTDGGSSSDSSRYSYALTPLLRVA